MTGVTLDVDRFPPGYRLGAYEVRRFLGAGAFADVYLARQVVLDQDVALKVIRSPVAEGRERQGARIMSRLRHPAIVRVLFADRIDGRLVIAMDHVRGRTLRAVLDESGRLPLARALEITTAICGALDYVHTFSVDDSSGLAHLDLKPGNVLIQDDGAVKITDFGLAQMLQGDATGNPLVAGSPSYMAPEQFDGNAVRQSDLWAVGVLLCEMLTGSTPFRGRTRDDSGQIDRGDITLPGTPATLPEPVAAVIRQCLQQDPQRRPRTAGDVAIALSATAAAKAGERCPRCHALLPFPGASCPDCTFAGPARQSAPAAPAFRVRPVAAAPIGPAVPAAPTVSPAFTVPVAAAPVAAAASARLDAPRGPQAPRRPWRRAAAVVAMLAVAASAGYGGVRGAAAVRSALDVSSRRDLSFEARDAILRAVPAGPWDRWLGDDVPKRRASIRAGRDAWREILRLETSPEGSYDQRVTALRDFMAKYPGTPESGQASQKVLAWEQEGQLFRGASDVESRPETRISEKLTRWKEFAAAQTTNFGKGVGLERVRFWQGQMDGYTGDADLTVASASSLPVMDSGVLGQQRPDAYFVLMWGTDAFYQSLVLLHDAAPVWNERCRIRLKPGSDLFLEIRDRHPGGYDVLLREKLTPLPVDGPFRVAVGSLEVRLEIQREK